MGCSGSKSVWHSVHEKTMTDSTRMHKLVLEQLQEGKIDPGEQKEISAIVQRHQQAFAAKNKALYKKVWIHYDRNNDGLLSIQETQILVRDALSETRNFLKPMARDIIQLSIECTKAMMRKDAGRKVSGQDLGEVDRRFELVHGKLVALLDRRLSEMGADYHRVGELLWRKMDPQAEGTVTQEKFLQHYAQASSELLDAQEATHEILMEVFRQIEVEHAR